MANNIPLSDIVDNPFQPRTSFDPDALRSLADEMKAEGFWNGSLQGQRKNGKIELVFGHRRLRALRMLEIPTVSIEVVELTDAQMALRSLEENLQREGLTDLEKADAVKRAVEIARADLKTAGKDESHAVAIVARRLGLVMQWVGELCRISEVLTSKNRTQVEAGAISAVTALAAKQWGGDEYVQTLAKQGKEAAKTEASVSKPTKKTVQAMKKVVTEAPDAIQGKLKELIWTGEVVTPKEAERLARKLASNHTKQQKEPPPDLRVVIVGWTHRVKELEQQMRDVIPYMDYVDEVPAVAKNFRDALEKLIATAKRLL